MPPCRGTVSPTLEMPPKEERTIPQRRKRPVVVTLIALLQFFRSGFILLVVLSTWLIPDAHLYSRLDVKVLTYIFARQNPSSPILIMTIMPLIAVYLSAIGLGLLFLKKWARNALIATSGMTVLLWVRRFMFDWALGNATLATTLQQQTIFIVIAIDGLVFCCLAMYPDVAAAFGRRD